MAILLIEDEPKTAAFITKGLREAGYNIGVASDGEEGLKRALGSQWDLFIVDVMLPKKDGWSLVADLRGGGVYTPVLFLTARDSISERVKGLEIGAEGYLVKPFAFPELLARIRSLIRRCPVENEGQIRIDDLEIDTRRNRAKRGGIALELSPKEFRLLVLLARARGEVVSRREIVDEVWGINFTASTNVIEVMMRRLRTKLDDPYEIYSDSLLRQFRGSTRRQADQAMLCVT